MMPSALALPLAALALILTTAHGATTVEVAKMATSAARDLTNATDAATSATACDAQLLFQKLYVLMPAINQCAMESDYFIQPSNLSLPSDASLVKYCNSKNCSQLSRELDNAGLPSCTVPVGNSTMAFKAFFKNIKDHCEASESPPSAAPIDGASDAGSTFAPRSLWFVAAGAVAILVVSLA